MQFNFEMRDQVRCLGEVLTLTQNQTLTLTLN